MTSIDKSLEGLLDLDFESIPDMLRLNARRIPTQVALVQDAQSMTYAELDLLTDTIASKLQEEGVEVGDAIAICAPTSLSYVAIFVGGLKAGAAVAPLSFSYGADALAGMVSDAGAKLLFTERSVEESLSESLKGQLRIEIIGAQTASLQDWLYGTAPTPRAIVSTPDQVFNIIYSSGTTGWPKGIVHHHLLRWLNVQRAIRSGYSALSRTLLSTPLYSNTTLATLFGALSLGGTIVLMEKFDALKYLELAQLYRITHTVLVPVQYQRIMAHPDFSTFDLSAFEMKFSTGAPFPPKLKEQVLARWPGGLNEIYGMTEGGGACMLEAHLYPYKLDTVGRPMPGNDIRLIDEDGREVPEGQAGEIVGHSRSMMAGYLNQPAASAELEWHDPSGKRFFRSGDIGRFDADGFLILLDRKKDMIISGGFNVFPSDLEGVLREHSDVDDVAVVAIPSDRWGETPLGFVVLKSEATADAEAILSWANERLGKTQRLTALEVVEGIPRNLSGKILKRELRQDYLNSISKRLTV